MRLDALVAFGDALVAYFAAIGHLAASVESAITAAAIPGAAERAAAQALSAELVKRVADVATVTAINHAAPELMFILKLRLKMFKVA